MRKDESHAYRYRGIVGKPTTRRYTEDEKAQAVRLVCQLRAELGTSEGTVKRVADQLGYGPESVRGWVRQAGIDAGEAPGVTSAEADELKRLRQENRELRRANDIPVSAASFFGAELDRRSFTLSQFAHVLPGMQAEAASQVADVVASARSDWRAGPITRTGLRSCAYPRAADDRAVGRDCWQ